MYCEHIAIHVLYYRFNNTYDGHLTKLKIHLPYIWTCFLVFYIQYLIVSDEELEDLSIRDQDHTRDLEQGKGTSSCMTCVNVSNYEYVHCHELHYV